MPPLYLHKLASNRMTTPKWKKKGIHDFQMEPKLSLGVIWWRIDVEFSLLSFSYLKKSLFSVHLMTSLLLGCVCISKREQSSPIPSQPPTRNFQRRQSHAGGNSVRFFNINTTYVVVRMAAQWPGSTQPGGVSGVRAARSIAGEGRGGVNWSSD